MDSTPVARSNHCHTGVSDTVTNQAIGIQRRTAATINAKRTSSTFPRVYVPNCLNLRRESPLAGVVAMPNTSRHAVET